MQIMKMSHAKLIHLDLDIYPTLPPSFLFFSQSDIQ